MFRMLHAAICCEGTLVMHARRVLAIAGLAMMPGFAAAQTIRGVVVDPTSQSIPGVVVLLLDSASAVVARDLSDERGAFFLTAVGAGSYRVRTLRIGFAPVTSAPARLELDEETTQRVVLTGLPFRLDTVRVAARSICETRPDSAAATHAVWEQVRSALMATELSAGSGAMSARFVSYDRVIDPLRRGRVKSQMYQLTSGLTARPWTSASAEQLSRTGYVVEEMNAVVYYAPDVAVLLSETFASDHCFRLTASRDPALIGIALEPTPERSAISGIEGTMWLDRRTSELREFVFRYTNIPYPQRTGDAGGDVALARMKNGAWVISAWSIRMPVLRVRTVPSSGFSIRSRRAAETRVDEVRVKGGELALVVRGPDTLWARPPLAFDGRIVDSLTGRGIAATQIALRGTMLRAKTDALGRFRLTDVLPGEYAVDVTTPSLHAVGASHTVEHAFTDPAAAATIRVPSGEQVALARCGNVADGIVSGRVVLSDGSDPPREARDARVVAQWDIETPTGKRPGLKEAHTDARGHYMICGVPLETTIQLFASNDSASAEPLALHVNRRLVVADFTLDRSADRGATLVGAVLSDVNAQPFADVEVAIPALDRNAFTNDQGQYRLAEIPAGTHLVVVRRIGYRAVTDSISFAAHQTIERTFELGRVQLLDTIAVTAPLDRDFEAHRRLGLGRFYTRADMEKMEQRTTSAVLAQMLGIRIQVGTGKIAWVTTSRGRDRPDSPPACYSNVYLGRLQVYSGRPEEPRFDVNSIRTADIEAIEYYASPMQVPLKYATGAECGVLVIHLRGYEPKKP
ncbi:MAG: carboxypeptidase regulatory-like domain-containing protein [Gemmatimonadaceae bacterium]